MGKDCKGRFMTSDTRERSPTSTAAGLEKQFNSAAGRSNDALPYVGQIIPRAFSLRCLIRELR